MNKMVQKIVILLLYIALSCAMFSKTNTFSLPMIPIDSPQLKLFPQGLTTQQRHELLMNVSMSRASMYSTMSREKSNRNLNQSASSINSIDTPVFWMPSNYYTTQVFFGAPSFVMSAYVVIDTGSANTWVQCEGCNPCFELKPGNLQVTKSPTYRYLTKDDPRCYPKITASPNLCGYQNQYAGGAKISGLVGEDTFIFPDSTTKIPDFFPHIAFACGLKNINVDFGLNTGPNNDIAGILGIAPGPLSFLNQLDSTTKGRFSQCLTPSVYESTGISTMQFGDAAQIGDGPDVRSIKLNSGGPYYHLSFRGISVDGERLANLDASKCAFDLGKLTGFIIDSGAPISLFPSQVYFPLRTAIAKIIDANGWLKIKVEYYDLCYVLPPGVTYESLRLPNVVFHFENGDRSGSEVDWVMAKDNMFIKKDYIKGFCLSVAMYQSPNRCLFGAYQQINFKVVYDVRNSILQFRPQPCQEFKIV